MNSNLPRWIFSSMVKHFSTVAATIPLNYYVEGVDEPESSDFQNDSVLFKMNGPVIHSGSKDFEWYSLEIMVFLTDIIQLTNDNAFSIQEWTGIFQASMVNDALQIFRYGTGAEDDDTLIGCLEPDPGFKNNIQVVTYGQVDKDLRIKQASVNGRFILCPL